MNEVLILVDNLESNKSAGVHKNADVILSVLLSFCFTCVLKHSYLPSAMLDSVIIPSVKNKCGVYQIKITIDPLLSLVLYQKSLKSRVEDYLWTTDNQFGFKADYSTDLCVYALTEFIGIFSESFHIRIICSILRC